jgi:hypothetical protein
MAEKTFRIISAAPAQAEHELNELAAGFTPIVWNIQPGPDGAMVTCVLVSTSELRRATLAQAPIFQIPRTQ